jgi:threonine synthase
MREEKKEHAVPEFELRAARSRARRVRILTERCEAAKASGNRYNASISNRERPVSVTTSTPWRSFAVDLRCTRCERVLSLDEVHNLCECGAPLSTSYDLRRAARELHREDLAERVASLWRYRDMLPVQSAEHVVTLGEGMTPLLELARLGARRGLPGLRLKDESLNPTNSFKARGMALAVSRALELGLRHLALPTAGNAGCALAAYAARAGLRASVFMPDDTPRAFVEECRALGAEVELVDGLIHDCARRVAAGKEQHGWFDLSTLKEPYRLEGKKTLGYELAEQLGWKLPDVIVYPTGGGTGLVGMWKAFAELEALGWVEAARPRMVTVQAEGCAPIVRAFHAGAERAEIWQNASTFALGLRVPTAVADFLMLRALRESRGTAVAVSEAEIASAGRELAVEEGIFASPEGAATWAAVRQLQQRGELHPEDEIVLFNTGGWYKYADGWRQVLGL